MAKQIIEKTCDPDIASMYYERAGRPLDDLYREYQNQNDKTGIITVIRRESLDQYILEALCLPLWPGPLFSSYC